MNKFRDVQDDLHEATELMRENIESVVNRGEHLELLMDKSEGLTASARQFQKHSTGLRVRIPASLERAFDDHTRVPFLVLPCSEHSGGKMPR